MSNRGHRAATGVKDVGKLATMLRRVGKGASHVLVGPALVYRDETLSMMVIVGSPGRAGRLVSVDLGTFEADPLDDALCAAADTVMWLRHADGVTKREGDATRLALIGALRRSFRHVEACDDELTLAEANLRWFPCADAKRVLAGVRAEQGLGA
jgi:hypothetical protein